ncbi:hypothetical protein Tco_1276256 [Tanacetum coccineum]
MLKVSSWKGVIRFGKRGKLNPRYIGPFKIIAKVGTVAYRIELPEQLSRVHSTFHVSNLKKCMPNEPLAIPLDEIQIDEKLYFIKEPVKIMDREVKRLKQSRIPIVKMLRQLVLPRDELVLLSQQLVLLEENSSYCSRLQLPVLNQSVNTARITVIGEKVNTAESLLVVSTEVNAN